MFESYNNEDQNYDIMIESKNTLRKLKTAKKNHDIDLVAELSEGFKKYDSGRDMYETYDILEFEGKSQVDMLYYEQLLKKITENDQINKIEGILTSLTKNVNQVYEISNLKPEIYGRKISVDILNDSHSESSSKISKQIYEFLDGNFYKLNVDQRNKKYFNEAAVISKKLITEGNDVDESIEYSVKCVVMENLLEKIAFPFSISSRINHLIESDIYSKVFDNTRLIDSVDNVNEDIRKLASIISVVI